MSELAELNLPLEVIDPERVAALGGRVLNFAVHEGGPEIFYTVQGEGRHLGEPSVFARLSNCNLQCNWCDTPQTWNWIGTNFVHDEGIKYDREAETVRVEIGDAVDQITGYKCRRVVITGGEPLLQRKALAPFIDELRARNPNQWVEIETNGTIPPGELAGRVNQFNVSPKLANSGNSVSRRRKNPALSAFAALPNADFKFVVTGPADVEEINELVGQYGIPPERVYLMAEGRTPEDITTRQQELVEVCKTNNYNLTTRLHVLIWGPKRGV
jgi:7-carboxy-7-deazaguanine synthase